DLVHEVVQTQRTGRADVHAGSLADRFEPLEDGDVLGVVAGRPARPRGSVPAALSLGFFCAFAGSRQWTSDDLRRHGNAPDSGAPRPPLQRGLITPLMIAGRGAEAAAPDASKSLQTRAKTAF